MATAELAAGDRAGAGRGLDYLCGLGDSIGWTHAQFIRLAWSIDAGQPVERPSLVSCRYGGPCAGAAP
jgi:glucoamylase